MYFKTIRVTIFSYSLVFSWFFNDEPVVPGQPGWEDAEIHDSRKMSTLLIPYAREYHMGKYTLVSENPLGHAVSNAELIVRKKQFPPVFWQRLYNYEAESGTDFFISGCIIPYLDITSVTTSS